MAANGFVFGTVDPRFVVARTLGGMVAVNWLKGCELEPASEQIGRRRSGKTSNVGAAQREAAKAKIDELRNGHAEVVPCRSVVSRPCGGVPLAPGIAGAGKHEGSLIRPQRNKTVVGGARVLHAVDIVDLKMFRGAFLEAGFGNAVQDVVRHGFRRNVEDSRLIHVVPEASHAVVKKVFVERSPPLTGDLAGEVGEDRWAGPYRAGIDRAVGILNEVIASGARSIRGVVGIGQLGDVQVGNGYDMKFLLSQLVDHL